MWTRINGGLAVAVTLSVLALYRINADTRRVAIRVELAERQVERIETDIAVLRAERAHLARPERLEPLALELGLRPVRPGQLILDITSVGAVADVPPAEIWRPLGPNTPR